MGTDKRRRAVVSTMQPKTKDDSVRMTAKALITTTTEPSRAHAVDLVLLGHLLAARLKRECSVDSESNFARVWRDHVVPVAAECSVCGVDGQQASGGGAHPAYA